MTRNVNLPIETKSETRDDYVNPLTHKVDSSAEILVFNVSADRIPAEISVTEMTAEQGWLETETPMLIVTMRFLTIPVRVLPRIREGLLVYCHAPHRFAKFFAGFSALYQFDDVRISLTKVRVVRQKETISRKRLITLPPGVVADSRVSATVGVTSSVRGTSPGSSRTQSRFREAMRFS